MQVFRRAKLVLARQQPENVLASIITAKCGFLCRCTHTCCLTVKISKSYYMCWKREAMRNAITWCTLTHVRGDYTTFCNRHSARFPRSLILVVLIFTFVVYRVTVAQRVSRSPPQVHECSPEKPARGSALCNAFYAFLLFTWRRNISLFRKHKKRYVSDFCFIPVYKFNC